MGAGRRRRTGSQPGAARVEDPTSYGADVATVNNAQFVSQTVPANLAIGAAVGVTMRNTGGRAWSPSLGHRLGSQSPQDNALWGANREQLATDVPPGQEATFNFTVTSVSSSHATFQWRMVQEEVEWFGDFTPPVPFIAPNDAICAQLAGEITALQKEIAQLQKELQAAAGSEKISIIHQICPRRHQAGRASEAETAERLPVRQRMASQQSQ